MGKFTRIFCHILLHHWHPQKWRVAAYGLLFFIASGLGSCAFAQANTLVAGVITDQHGQVPNDRLEVKIFADKRKITTCTARDGLFVADLKGIVAPNTVITVLVKEQEFDRNDIEKSRSYSEEKIDVALAKAYNLRLQLHFQFEKDQPEVGPYPDMPNR